MGTLAILEKYRHFHNELPLSVVDRLADLPAEAQLEFYEEYTRRSRSEVAAYVLHFFFALRYGYVDKWVIQVIAWLLLFVGVGWVWWVVDFFRIPGLVKNHNKKVARNILKNVLLKYRRSRNNTMKQFKVANNPRMTITTPSHPRDLSHLVSKTAFGEPTTSQLTKGDYLILDGEEESLQVVYEGQYDWNDENSEKEFKLIDESDTAKFLFVRHEKGQWKNLLVKMVSVYSIHEGLEEEILGRQRPFNILEWEGVSYYRENEKDGYFFDLEQDMPTANGVKIWEYYDSSRKSYLRIKQLGRKEFRAYVGNRLSGMEVTILPNAPL